MDQSTEPFVMSNIKKLVIVLAGIVSLALGTPQSATAATSAGTVTVTPRIAAGVAHTVALKPDGSLWAWGRNDYGQLGDSSKIDSLVPIQIGTGYAAIAAGFHHTAALKSDGSLWAWGYNAYGQLGDSTTTDSLVPKQIGTGYTAIATGSFSTVALKSDGSLWAWGYNTSGQLGDGTTATSLLPKQIDTGYTAIAAGPYHTVGIKSDGSLWAWGSQLAGQPDGNFTTYSLVPVRLGTGYTTIAAGSYQTVALKADGSLWSWEPNNHGQLGDGTPSTSLVPKQIDTGYTAITAGSMYALGIKRDGSLWAWGNNLYGQLGDGTTSASLAPKLIGAGYMMVAAGDTHTVAIKADGGLWAWGNNYSGQFGDGTTTASLIPRPISTGYTVPDSVAPGIPSGLIVIPAGATQVNVFWTTPLDNVAVAGYKVYRDGVLVGSPTLTNYSDTGLTALTAYSYAVAACDASGNCSARSTAVSATTLAPRDIHLPTVPTGLTATAIGTTQIDLAWTPATDSIGITQYKISRRMYYPYYCPVCDVVAPLPTVVTLSGTPPATSYSDTGLSQASRYYYSVQACNAAGNCSAQSETVHATTQSIPGFIAIPTIYVTEGGITITSRAIIVTMLTPASVLDLRASVFAVAITPSSMGGKIYLLSSDGSWTPFTACASAAAAYSGKLDALVQLNVVPTLTDLSAWVGTSIYVGYGIGNTSAATCADMLNKATTAPPFTIH